MSKTYNIKGDTIFSVNDDGSITTIATIDNCGKITPVNRRPYIYVEADLIRALEEIVSLKHELSKATEALDKLRQRPQLDSTRSTTSTIFNNMESLTNWMKILMGSNVFLSIVTIAVLIFYTGSVKNVSNSSIMSKDSIVGAVIDSKGAAVQTKAINKDVDLTRLPLIIKDIAIANVDKKGTIISDYGKEIESSKTKYLKPRITYFGVKNNTTTLRVKWVMPDGSLRKGKSSIGDYSQIEDCVLSVGKIDKLCLRSWGTNKEGNWGKGDYNIEIWYEDILLIRKPFTIK